MGARGGGERWAAKIRKTAVLAGRIGTDGPQVTVMILWEMLAAM